MSMNHAVVSHSEWLKARKKLLEREKELTHLRDAIAAERLQLPWEKVEKEYVFDTPEGRKTLADLFAGRSQLLVYHFMFGKGWESPCKSCSYVADHMDGCLPHLNARGVTLTVISRAELPQLERIKKRLGWKFPWVSSGNTDFNFDMQVSFKPEQLQAGPVEYNYALGSIPLEELPGLSAFYKDNDGQIYHTYSAYARGLDSIVNTYNYLDLAPLGRNEDGLKFTMAWVRLNDEYGPGYVVDANADYTPPKGSCGSSQKAGAIV